MKKFFGSITLVMLVLIISACSSAEEDVYKALEQVVVKEEEFEQEQKPLTELEEKEQAIFEKIMELNIDDLEEITKLADEALENLSERENILESEKEAMEKSIEQFKKAEEKMKSVKDENLKKQSTEIAKTMNERYESYDDIYKSYKEGIAENKKIYELLKQEDLKLEDLEKQIDTANESSATVIATNEKFNELTEKFNEEKLEFYKAAKLNVDVEK